MFTINKIPVHTIQLLHGMMLCTGMVNFFIGLLSSVVILDTDSSTSSVTISWVAPFSLDVTDMDPDVWYSILIYNVTDEDNPTAVLCTDCHNLTQTHYIFSPDHPSPCHKYNFTVIPYNGAGQGESQSATQFIIGSEFAFQALRYFKHDMYRVYSCPCKYIYIPSNIILLV